MQMNITEIRTHDLHNYKTECTVEYLLTQTIKATHGFVSLATRVLPVNIKAPTIMMEKINRPIEATYRKIVKGVSATSCADSCSDSLTVESTTGSVVLMFALRFALCLRV